MDTKTSAVMQKAYEHLKKHPMDIQIPPPVFDLMQGVVTAFDEVAQTITIRFPVQAAFENPYGSMQGGMIATALDNTIGPVALLHARPNVTKELQISYHAMITRKVEYFYVDAWYVGEEGNSIYYEAKAHDGKGVTYTTAKAHHRVLRAR